MNSLATMACASQLSKALGLHIRPTDVLAHASPAALAEALYERVHGRAASSTAATAVEGVACGGVPTVVFGVSERTKVG